MTEASRWNIRQVYLYLVCFATLMMLIVGSVQLVMSLVDFVYPEQFYYPDAKARIIAENQKMPNVTQEEIDRQVEEERQRGESAMERSRVRRMINSVAFIVVSLPVYVYHWRKIQRGET